MHKKLKAIKIVTSLPFSKQILGVNIAQFEKKKIDVFEDDEEKSF